MDIETRIRNAAPPIVKPSAELQQRVLTQLVMRKAPPLRSGWSALIHSFAHNLVRYPIPVLTGCWLVWLLSNHLTGPFGTDVWLSRYVYSIVFWRR